MFDKYIICEDGFCNVSDGKDIIGYQFNTRLPYYRGLGLSMVEDLMLKVDGQNVDRDSVRLTLHGNSYTMQQMETEYEDVWEFGEVATLMVMKKGGLQPGEHQIDLTPHLRISYLPFMLIAQDQKNLALR